MELDQRRLDPPGIVALQEDTKQVASIPGTQAEDADRSGMPIKGLPEESLDGLQPPGQPRAGIVVRLVPFLVVSQPAHSPQIVASTPEGSVSIVPPTQTRFCERNFSRPLAA
jgi:hypothetical protein